MMELPAEKVTAALLLMVKAGPAVVELLDEYEVVPEAQLMFDRVRFCTHCPLASEPSRKQQANSGNATNHRAACTRFMTVSILS